MPMSMFARIVVVARVDLRKIGQAVRQRPHQEGQQRQLGLVSPAGVIEVCAQLFEFGEIALFDIGEVRNAPLRFLHLLRDLAPQTDHLHRLDPTLLGKPGGARATGRWNEHVVEILVRDASVGTAAAD